MKLTDKYAPTVILVKKKSDIKGQTKGVCLSLFSHDQL